MVVKGKQSMTEQQRWHCSGGYDDAGTSASCWTPAAVWRWRVQISNSGGNGNINGVGDGGGVDGGGLEGVVTVAALVFGVVVVESLRKIDLEMVAILLVVMVKMVWC